MGGISSGRHAADFIAAGASAVAVGTESFRDPAAGRRIAAELAELSLDGSVARACLDARLTPFGGQRARPFSARCGNFPALRPGAVEFAHRKPLQTKRKTLKDPQPTSS